MHALMMTDDIAILFDFPPSPKRGFFCKTVKPPPQTLNSGNRPYDTPYIFVLILS